MPIYSGAPMSGAEYQRQQDEKAKAKLRAEAKPDSVKPSIKERVVEAAKKVDKSVSEYVQNYYRRPPQDWSGYEDNKPKGSQPNHHVTDSKNNTKTVK